MICKPEEIATEAKRIFKNTGINITQTAQKHLGAVIGEIESCRKLAEDQIKTWRSQVRTFSKAAHSEPYLSYIVYTGILLNMWKYFQGTLDNVSDLMKPLEETRSFLEVITGRQNSSETDRDITALPIRLEEWGFQIRLSNAGNYSAVPIF